MIGEGGEFRPGVGVVCSFEGVEHGLVEEHRVFGEAAQVKVEGEVGELRIDRGGAKFFEVGLLNVWLVDKPRKRWFIQISL